MLLLAKLSAVDSTRCSRRADGNPAGGTSRGPAEGRQYSSTDIQRLRYEETGCEEGEVRRPLENRGFLVEVMVAAAEKALEADRPPADAVKKVTLDDREMFPVVWCITRFDQMIFSKFARKRTDVSMGEIPLGGTPSEVFQSSVRRRERTRSEQADEAHETPSRDKTCPVDTEEDDGFSYKFVLGGMAHHHSEDELTKDVVDMYMQARAKLLRRATQGVRTIIVSRLRCAPLDAAMHYFSFVLSNATFEELLTLADGFRHLRIAQERVWNVWCQQVERRLSLHACQDSSWEDRRDPPLRPPSLETLQAVRGWFQLLGRPCPLIEALLAQVTVRAEQMPDFQDGYRLHERSIFGKGGTTGIFRNTTVAFQPYAAYSSLPCLSLTRSNPQIFTAVVVACSDDCPVEGLIRQSQCYRGLETDYLEEQGSS
nr:hypothetical protein TgIb.1620 [Toxoplasma gondii RH]